VILDGDGSEFDVVAEWHKREEKHTLLTPGLLCGKFPINDCIRSAFRAGTQIAVTANSR
jgi:hypothetical protein